MERGPVFFGSERLNFAITTGLAILLGITALLKGGVYPEQWFWLAGGTALVGAVYFGVRRNSGDSPPLTAFDWLAMGFVLVPLAQWVRLPMGIVSVLSPARAEMVRRAWEASGESGGWVSLSESRPATWEYLLSTGAYVVTYLVIRHVAMQERWRLWRVAAPVVVIGALEAVLGWVQFLMARSTSTQAMATGTFANRNHFAGMLEMALPLAIAAAFQAWQGKITRHTRPARAGLLTGGLILLAMMILVGIVFSLSRMGFLAALAGMAMTGMMALSGTERTGGKQGRWRAWIAAAPIALVAVLFVFLPPDELIGRFAEFAGTEEIGGDTRAEIWKDTLKLIGTYPLLGCGMGAYEVSLLRFKTAAPQFTVDYAHNDYLQILAETGIVGFGIGMALVVMALVRCGSVVVWHRQGKNWWLSVGLLGAMSSLLLHSLVDFNLYIPSNAMMLAWLVGLASSEGLRE
jgi:O-antigen ligase